MKMSGGVCGCCRQGPIRVLKNKNQVVRQSDFEKRSISEAYVSILEKAGNAA